MDNWTGIVGHCAFCEHHTHDFPDEWIYHKLHEMGAHVCEIDGEFRDYKENCPDFELSSGCMFSDGFFRSKS